MTIITDFSPEIAQWLRLHLRQRQIARPIPVYALLCILWPALRRHPGCNNREWQFLKCFPYQSPPPGREFSAKWVRIVLLVGKFTERAEPEKGARVYTRVSGRSSLKKTSIRFPVFASSIGAWLGSLWTSLADIYSRKVLSRVNHCPLQSVHMQQKTQPSFLLLMAVPRGETCFRRCNI
jgi:hypothetical protein